MRGFGEKPISLQGPAPLAGHVGLGARFVYEHQARRIQSGQFLKPLLPPLPDVFAVLFAGVERFFYSGSPVDPGPASPP